MKYRFQNPSFLSRRSWAVREVQITNPQLPFRRELEGTWKCQFQNPGFPLGESWEVLEVQIQTPAPFQEGAGRYPKCQFQNPSSLSGGAGRYSKYRFKTPSSLSRESWEALKKYRFQIPFLPETPINYPSTLTHTPTHGLLGSQLWVSIRPTISVLADPQPRLLSQLPIARS